MGEESLLRFGLENDRVSQLTSQNHYIINFDFVQLEILPVIYVEVVP